MNVVHREQGGSYLTALRWTERATGVNDLWLGLLSIDPPRSDPRLQRLADELGLPNGYEPVADTYEADTEPRVLH